MWWWNIVSFSLLLSLCYVEARISCKGLSGANVDWYIVYKLPTGVPNGNGGKGFFYLDSKNSQWQLSKKDIEDETIAVGATVSQIYKNEPSAFHLLYSDDGPQTRSDGYRGHAKGVLLFDASTGYWMVHSAPNFPPLGSYSYPKSALKFAQTFICVTLKTDDLGHVGEQLRFIQATPFSHNLPQKFATRFPVFRMVIAKQSLPKSATIFTSTKKMYTTGGTIVHSFAKHKKHNKDVWQLVADTIQTNLAVQSWLNGGAVDLHSNCRTDYSVYDMETVTVPNATFTNSKDHSKWAVSDKRSMPIVCVGDLNRQKSQLARGGGAVCLQHLGLWETYRTTVHKVEPCAINGIDHWMYSCLVVMLIVVYWL